MTVETDDTAGAISLRETLLVLALAVALTMIFWWPLWTGGGLIGGDIYSYFFPQKQFLADSLSEGEFPLWNNRTGFGYPLIAESQTGALYPPHLLLYATLDVNTAYNVNQLLHYVLAFVSTWLLARTLGLTGWGSVFAATVYVYGWFPPRLCLEWAIIGGAWLPLALLLLERFLRSRLWLWLAGMAVVLAVQMLAGHFNLAFITQLLLVAWVPLRLFFWTDQVEESLRCRRVASCCHVALALGLGFGLAAVQLLPTLELKQISQRETPDGQEFDPGHGHIPPLYLSQVVASWWYWYDGDPDFNLDQALAHLTMLAVPSGTNRTEAHLYFGLTTLVLIAVVLLRPDLRDAMRNRQTVVWLLISAAAILYAVGWLLPIGRHLPGFGFFRGPGRYGILTTLAVGMIAGTALGGLLRSLKGRTAPILGLTILALTVWDLRVVARRLEVSVMVQQPALEAVEYSRLPRLLQQQGDIARLYAPGPNLPNLLGVASVPEYLGLGPAPYYHPSLRAPELESATPQFLDWAKNAAITHVLSFRRLYRPDGNELRKLVFSEPDPFLNRAWGRHLMEPLYVYQLNRPGRPLRIRFADPQPGQKLAMAFYKANSVGVRVETKTPATLILADLDFPGWTVTIDDQPAVSKTYAGQFRSVEVPAGEHNILWTFEPASFKTGAAVSLTSLLAIIVIAAVTWRSGRGDSNSTAPTNQPDG